jgi:hypothetical protein
MEKEFVSYEMALELKELGFDEPCYDNYNIYGKLWGLRLNKQVKIKGACLAPTFSQAFKFFREKHKLPSWVYTSDNEKFYYGILRDTRFLIDGNKPYETYEEAELACLIKLIEVVILAQKKMI